MNNMNIVFKSGGTAMITQVSLAEALGKELYEQVDVKNIIEGKCECGGDLIQIDQRESPVCAGSLLPTADVVLAAKKLRPNINDFNV